MSWGYLYRKNGMWFLRVRRQGQQVYFSTGTDNRAKAEKARLRLYKKYGDGEPVPNRRFSWDAAFQLLEKRAHRRGTEPPRPVMWNRLVDHFAAYGGPAMVTTGRIAEYIDDRLKAGAASNSVRNEVGLLQRALREAHRVGRLATVPPFERPTSGAIRTGYYSSEEITTILANLPQHLAAVTQFAALTGWRVGKIVRLVWDWVDFQAGKIYADPNAPSNKQAGEVVFRRWPELRQLLERQWERGQALTHFPATVFFKPDGTPISRHFTGRPVWHRAVIAAGARIAGSKGYFHDLRRTAGRNMVRAGVAEEVARKITGHQTRAMFDRYNITVDSDLEEAGARVSGGG